MEAAATMLYVVDTAADTVIETQSGGKDRIIARANYALPDHIETLELSEGAIVGTGNSRPT